MLQLSFLLYVFQLLLFFCSYWLVCMNEDPFYKLIAFVNVINSWQIRIVLYICNYF